MGVDDGKPFADPQPISVACETTLDCIYCVLHPNEAECGIEFDRDQTPCQSSGMGENLPAPPGAMIRLDRTGPLDLFDQEEFTAGTNEKPHIRTTYHLAANRLSVLPTWPSHDVEGVCCAWLCHWVIHHGDSQLSWFITCNKPIIGQYPNQARQRLPRSFPLHPGRQIMHIHFGFDANSPCFVLSDQFCLTYGLRDSTDEDPDFWEHLNGGDTKLSTLDRLNVDLDMRLAVDPVRYPWNEPECLTLYNDALQQLKRIQGLDQLDRPGSRQRRYDASDLNRWFRVTNWQCANAPVVRRNGGTGEPWTVYVRPYGHDCVFEADLVIESVAMELRASGDKACIRNPTGSNNPLLVHAIRIAATFDCQVTLNVRLRPGWDDTDCDVKLAVSSPCDFAWNDDAVVTLAGTEGCSAIQRKVKWRGISGPRPFARGPFNYEPIGGDACCDFLKALDGCVIPGEVNDTTNPDATQRFEGDVVIGMTVPPGQLCG
jgi:hypothetical protein